MAEENKEPAQSENESSDTTTPENRTDSVSNGHPSTHQPPPVDISSLTTAIAALPEQIVNAVREAITPPKTPTRTTTPKTVDKPATEPSETKPPGHKTFSEWWFGR